MGASVRISAGEQLCKFGNCFGCGWPQIGDCFDRKLNLLWIVRSKVLEKFRHIGGRGRNGCPQAGNEQAYGTEQSYF